MNTETKTFLLALEVKPIELNKNYTQLPMHCTIMPRFLTTLNPTQLADELAPIIEAQSAVKLIAQGHVAFGPKKQLVTLVEPTNEIISLHKAIFDRLNDLGVQYTEQDWVGDGYIPHVTDKQGQRLTTDKLAIPRTVYLIEVEHPLNGRNRTARHKFDLEE